MGTIWEGIGFFRWPISLCFLLLVLLSLWAAQKLFRPGATPALRTKAWLDGVLVSGILAFLFGILGAVTGIILSFQAVEAVGAFSGPAMAPGIKATLLSQFFGTFTFGVGLLLWFVLRLRWRLLHAAGMEAEA